MIYDALDISEYICYYCEKIKGNAITNLHLQKYLFFIFKELKHKNNIILFDNKIVAWKYGPSIPDVYYWYCDNLNNPLINIKPKKEIDKNIIDLINPIIDKLLKLKLNDLFDKSKEEECWKDNYIEGKELEIRKYEI